MTRFYFFNNHSQPTISARLPTMFCKACSWPLDMLTAILRKNSKTLVRALVFGKFFKMTLQTISVCFLP